MSPTDSGFLLLESREQPMHVGSLQLFNPPADMPPGYLRENFEQLLHSTDIATPFRRRPYRSATTLGQWAWTDDEDVDLEHHVRHSALPDPGRIRELLALVSRLHGTLLDRKRPLWEMHLIEGLDDGRFAVYTKLHHAVMDGVSGLRLLQRVLTEDPEEEIDPAWWAPRSRGRKTASGGGLLAVPGAVVKGVTDLVGLAPAAGKLVQQVFAEQAAALPGQAPRSMLNVPITGARRFAAQSYPMEQMRAVARASGTTLNDVVLATCAGALRAYMLELDALPDDPLIAMTPVSLRGEDSGDDSGNAVGAVLCNLGTDIADAGERLAAINASMLSAKGLLRGLSQLQATAVSAFLLSPMALMPLGLSRFGPPPYNLVISNVPGPRDPLYLNGARLDGVYPLSIPLSGQALNITVTSYIDNMEFGLIGCRRSVPHLQRLLVHIDDALAELVKVTGA
jgi:diacylglycerol O-acyltransferase